MDLIKSFLNGLLQVLVNAFDYFFSRWVVVLFIAVLWLICSSDVAQIVHAFRESGRGWSRVLSLGFVATACFALFASRPGRQLGWRRWADLSLYGLPIFIVGLLPDWGTNSPWTLAAATAIYLLAANYVLNRDRHVRINTAVMLGSLVVFGCASLAFWSAPVGLGRFMGSAAVAMLFCALAFTLLGALSHRPKAALVAAVVVAVGLSVGEFRHQAEERIVSPNPINEMPQLTAFAQWLFTRADAEHYRRNNLPYPVFMVSSEGGGGYALAHAFSFLHTMSERCPNFQQHLFALVGVSGGQIGNTLFHASYADASNPETVAPCDWNAPPRHVDFLAEDHLSPLLGHLLFVEFPARMVPGLGQPRTGRTRVLLDSFNASADGYQPIPDQSYLHHFWDMNPDGTDTTHTLTGKPALIAVTTDLETGNRFVFSPFAFFSRGQTSHLFFSTNGDAGNGRQTLIYPDLGSVSAASASFPWLTPSMRFTTSQHPDAAYPVLNPLPRMHGDDRPRVERSVNLVDGGYFENSGAETLSEIVVGIEFSRLQRRRGTAEEDNRWENTSEAFRPAATHDTSNCRELRAVRVTRLTEQVAWRRCEMPFFLVNVLIRNTPSVLNTGERQSFLLDPIRAMLQTQSARGEFAVRILGDRQCPLPRELANDLGRPFDSCQLGVTMPVGSGVPTLQFANGLFQSLIDTSAMELPLGWDMPQAKMEVLERYVAPTREHCESHGDVFILPQIGLPIQKSQEEALRELAARNCQLQEQLMMYFDFDRMTTFIPPP